MVITMDTVRIHANTSHCFCLIILNSSIRQLKLVPTRCTNLFVHEVCGYILSQKGRVRFWLAVCFQSFKWYQWRYIISKSTSVPAVSDQYVDTKCQKLLSVCDHFRIFIRRAPGAFCVERRKRSNDKCFRFIAANIKLNIEYDSDVIVVTSRSKQIQILT